MNFNLAINSNGEGSVSFIADGQSHIITHEHPNFRLVVDRVLKNEDPSSLLMSQNLFEIDKDIEVIGGKVFFGGEEIHNTVTRKIASYQATGQDPSNLVKFLKRLMKNPSRHSREQLFRWVERSGLTVDTGGCIVGFKGITKDDLSINSGTAWVDGVKHKGQTPNKIGSVISMPRDMVEDDPSRHCSHGLHVGSYFYAKTFGDKLMEVRIDPADVVSVPNDSNANKLRCCRYEVLAFHDKPDDDLSHWEPDANWDDLNLDEWEIPETFVSKLKSKIQKFWNK